MHSTYVRALIGSWLLWFTATVIQPPQVRVCPIHSPAAHAAHVGHAAHLGHAMHGATSQSSRDHATCDCPDACRCGAPPPATIASTYSWQPPAVVAATPAVVHACDPLALVRAHALPFSTAPPLPSASLI